MENVGNHSRLHEAAANNWYLLLLIVMTEQFETQMPPKAKLTKGKEGSNAYHPGLLFLSVLVPVLWYKTNFVFT